MSGHSVTKRLTIIAALVAAYFGSAQLGLSLASAHHNVSLIWPSTGIALAAVLLLGYWVWPAITLGAFLANAATGLSLFTSGGIAVGNTLEALGGAFLVRRLIEYRNPLDQAQDVFRFVGSAVLLSTMVSATIGTASLCLGMAASWSDYGQLWWAWWLGDAAGALVVTPAVLAWNARRKIVREPRQVAEVALLLVLVTLVSYTVFTGWISSGVADLSLVYLPVPFLIWAAVRFHQRTVTTAILLTSGIAIWGTAHGLGPFARGSTLNESLFLLHTFVGITAVMSLVMAAVVAERRQADVTQRSSQEQYKLLVEQARDIIYRADAQGHFTFVNPTACRIMGYTREELIGRHFTELVHPDAREASQRFYLRQLARKTPSTYYEFPAMSKEGREIWLGQNVQVLLENDQVVCVHAMARDITERKRAEGELHSALDRLRAVIGNSPIAVISLDTQGRVTGWNQAAVHMFGWTEREVLGLELPYLAPGQEQESETIWEQVIRGDGLDGLELRRLRKDGTPIDIAVWSARLLDQQGTVIGTIGLQVDITERKAMEQTLQASENQFRTLTNFAPVGIYFTDPQGNCLLVNERWSELAGLSPKEAKGRGWIQALHPEDRERVRQEWYGAAQAGREFHSEYRFQTRNGTVNWLVGLAITVRDSKGTVTGYIGSVTDITKRKRAEEALAASEKRLRTILEAEPECVKVTTEDGILLDMNAAGLAMIEVDSLQQVVGQSICPIVAPAYRDAFADFNRRVYRGEPGTMQFEIIGFKGRRLWMDTHAVPLCDEHNVTIGVLAITRDITERKREEKILQALLEGTASVTGAQFFPALVRALARALGVRHALVTELLDDEQPRLRMLAIWIGDRLGNPTEYNLIRTPCEKVITLGAAYYQHSVQKLFPEDKDLVALGAVSYLGIALANSSGKTIGHLCIVDDKPLPDEHHIAPLLKVFASRAAAELERKQAEEALRERARLMSFVAEVSLMLNRETPTDEMLRQCMEATVRQLGAALTRIWIIGPGDLCQDCFKAAWCADRAQCLHLVASAGLSTNLDGEYRRVPLGALKIGRIAQGMGIMVTNNVLDDERLPNKDWLRENGLQSFAGFPLIIEGKVFGVLAMFAKTPLSEPTIQALESICNGIAAAIARKRAEQGLHERSRQQAIEAELSLLAVTTPDLLTLLNTAAVLAANALQVDYCEVLELFSNGSELRLRASAGWKSEHIGQVRAMETGSLAHATLHSNKPVIIQNLLADARFSGPPWLHKHEAVGGMSVSITGKESPWGVLGVYTAGTRAFSRDDINFLQTVSSILATAIERTQAEDVLRSANQALRTLSRQLLQVQEDDRRAIARDLHDEIGQSLTAIKLNVERAQRTSDRAARDRIMKDCVQITDGVLNQVRNLSLDLHPSILDDLGLSYALKWYADRQAERAGLKVDVAAEPSLPRLSPNIEIACFRIAQEALTNVVRHAQASRASITLKRLATGVELCVEDDGIGFVMNEVSWTAGGVDSVGMTSMQERAKLLGGVVKITSAPRCGTRVIATLPLQAASSAGMPADEVPRS